MKINILLIAGIAICQNLSVYAQSDPEPGIWQTFGDPLSISQYPILNGRLCNFAWADIEPSNNSWNWTAFDKDLQDRTNDGLPVIFMVYTKEDAPDWIYNAGVPKVPERDSKGTIISYSPYYADEDYKFYFKRMIQKVHAHLETLSPSIRNGIVGVQGCYGSTGDYISYKGEVPPEYDLTGTQMMELYQIFSKYYYDEYKNTSPKIYLMSNPRNQGDVAAIWTEENCPGWQKTGTLGKAFQLNDEKTKLGWLYDMMNLPKENGEYMRTRSEMSSGNTSMGWWKKSPYKNMFAVMCYGVSWGLDWNNQGYDELRDHNNDSAFSFFAKYAGQKDPAVSTNAMCALKDVLDAADDKRFPAGTYGTVSRTNQQRYVNIVNKYRAKGALLEDVKSATMAEMDNIRAKGTNDVGWDMMPDNYDRFIHQLTPNETSVGYWNIQSAEVNSMYGRFGRSFDVATNKKALYFDLDNAFLSNKPLNGKYSVTLEITYLDKGNGGWQLFYDAKTNANKASSSVLCKNSNKWLKTTVTLKDAYFGNRGTSGSDFYIKSTSNTENVIFSIVELSRPSNFVSGNLTSLSAEDNAAATGTTADVNVKVDTRLKAQVFVSPNPVQDQFFIRMNNNDLIKQVLIYNQAGQLLLQKQVSDVRIPVRRSEIGNVSGVYFIKVRTAAGVHTAKVTVL